MIKFESFLSVRSARSRYAKARSASLRAGSAAARLSRICLQSRSGGGNFHLPMASPASISFQYSAGTKSLLRTGAALGVHTFLVYACACRLSPWLVYHWFGWIVPIAQLSIDMPAGDWYLRHLELATIVPAFICGAINMTRFLPPKLRSYLGDRNLGSVAFWAWVVPALILGASILLYRTPSSVLYGKSVSAVAYFFDIQKVMPTRANLFASDPVRVWRQMTRTAPFYAGVAYSLGAFASKRGLLMQLFTFQGAKEGTA